MDVVELRPRLWRWALPHPEWEPADAEGGEGWQQEVASYALVAEDELVVFDPLVPPARRRGDLLAAVPPGAPLRRRRPRHGRRRRSPLPTGLARTAASRRARRDAATAARASGRSPAPHARRSDPRRREGSARTRA